jgi:membrane carboxypeptidase/penicillin-binding protein PbpC
MQIELIQRRQKPRIVKACCRWALPTQRQPAPHSHAIIFRQQQQRLHHLVKSLQNSVNDVCEPDNPVAMLLVDHTFTTTRCIESLDVRFPMTYIDVEAPKGLP